jgi:general transcription factor 3C polypeptide 3 (transcription factor C subunit 4)
VEYNLGRAFQQLGLLTYAVNHYETVLRIAEERMAVDSDEVRICGLFVNLIKLIDLL